MNINHTLMLHFHFRYPWLVLGAVLFSGCVSITGFQTGKVLETGKTELGFSINAASLPTEFKNYDELFYDYEFFPSVEGTFRFGLSPKMDLGLKANTFTNVAIDAKYQLLGDQHSKTALSIGLGIGSFTSFFSNWNFQLPLYASVHPTPKLDVYVNPRYTWHTLRNLWGINVGRAGINAGLIYGTDVKIGFDIGIHNYLGDDIEIYKNILTFGTGMKFIF